MSSWAQAPAEREQWVLFATRALEPVIVIVPLTLCVDVDVSVWHWWLDHQ